MKTLTIIIASLLLYTNSQSAASEGGRNRETLGIRMGYVRTTDGFDNNFGSGFAILVHFTEKIKPPVGIDVSLGSFSMGETNRPDITQRTFLSQHTASINVLLLAVSPTVEVGLGRKTSIYFSGGAGLYSITLVLDTGFFSASNSQNHLGLNAGGGFYYEITTNWKLDLNLAINKIWTSSDAGDWFYIYSEGDSDPVFYQITVGATYAVK